MTELTEAALSLEDRVCRLERELFWYRLLVPALVAITVSLITNVLLRR